MATVESYRTRLGDKRYRVRYRTPDRKQTDRRGFKTKRAAEEFASSVEVSKLRGEYIRPKDTRATIGVLGVEWLARQTHLKPSALHSVESAWRVHVRPRWAGLTVTDLRPTQIQAWVSELTGQRSATTVIRVFGVLSAILDDAVRDRRLLSNPARGTKLPRKTRKENRYLTHHQVHELAEQAGEHAPMVLLLAYCGLRFGEAAALRVRDCDFRRRRVTVAQNAVEVGGRTVVGTPKNHRHRVVPIPHFLADHLARLCEGKDRDALLFPGPSGTHMHPPRGTRGWFEGARLRAGLERLTPHDLRHTAASLAVSAGANVKAVQRMLGHSSAAMTLDVYADLFDDDLDAVARAMDHAAASASVGKMWAKSSGHPLGDA
ncbi:tyrosine-type recombinase/integrase [Nakamurella sp. YIM 132087]|uniref:Tyrosine-type recombinase/integrase n=2 Tax=Nakamurella alba TaxID=2665158 RepID=A0A7K1FMY0_9ACTN|nr:tyrosine-type recombinase/integrase [Nakamurella alba]